MITAKISRAVLQLGEKGDALIESLMTESKAIYNILLQGSLNIWPM